MNASTDKSRRSAFGELDARLLAIPGCRRAALVAQLVFEDAADEGRIVENFLLASWTEHLRQHERITNADRIVQENVARFHLDGAPKVTHFIAASS